MPKIWIEICLALEDKQYLLRLDVDRGTTVEEALSQTDLPNTYPEYFLEPHFGIFGTSVTDDYVLHSEDRIEIYRPLKIDPKQNRRIRSEKKNG